MSTTARISLPLVAVAALLAMAGCGTSGTATSTPPSAGAAESSSATSVGSPPAARALLSRATAAVKSATSVRVDGNISHSGTAEGMDLALTKSGDVYGTLVVGGGTLTVLGIGGKSYVKVSAAFLKEAKLPSAACVLMCGKWLKLRPSDAKNMLSGIGWTTMVGSTSGPPPAGLKVRGTATVNGVPAWILRPSAGGAIYIAARGQPYPLRLVAPGHAGQINLTDWNTATIPPPPPASEVVDLSQLGA
jgi:hypothetical protein